VSRAGPTIPAMRLRTGLALLPLALAPLAACAPADDDSGSDSGSAAEETTSAAPSEDASASASPTAAATEAGAVSPECAPDQLPLKSPGVLTVGTDKPAYEPWFVDNDPTNGQGYESAVAYAVAETLGTDVTWVTVPFNTSYKPGAKDFDFDINQISITPERAEVVDFSDGYYQAAQAVIALKDSDIASAASIADLASYRLGAQTGTTSLTAIRETISAEAEPAVFEDTNAAKQALLNGQVDGIVADLPTAFYITAAEIEDSVIVGQFQPVSGEQEEFGMLFEKGNPLVGCVNEALAVLTADGTLQQLQDQWLSSEVDVPVLP
jgi:polar amino acid transport system substrate-binding protein